MHLSCQHEWLEKGVWKRRSTSLQDVRSCSMESESPCQTAVHQAGLTKHVAAALLFCSHKDCCPLLDSVLEVVHSYPDSQSRFQRESPIVSPRDTDTINPKPPNPKPIASWNTQLTKNAEFELADLPVSPRKNRVHRRVGAYMAPYLLFWEPNMPSTLNLCTLHP